jgi:hypothetical protein
VENVCVILAPRTRTVIATALVLACLGCSSDEPSAKEATDLAACGLPKPNPEADAGLLPEPFLLEGDAEVIQVEVEEGRVIAGLGLRQSVDQAFDRLRTAIPEASYELLQEDNEHFEAELYIKKGKELASIQIRGSTCPDAVIVYLNLPKEKAEN